MALILDDYHLIESQAIHHAITFLLDGLPPHVHLIIASWAKPSLPLARLRARGHLLELNAVDFRFTPRETAALLRQFFPYELSEEHVQLLAARTEG